MVCLCENGNRGMEEERFEWLKEEWVDGFSLQAFWVSSWSCINLFMFSGIVGCFFWVCL